MVRRIIALVCFIAVAAIVMVRMKGNIAKPNANALSDEEVVSAWRATARMRRRTTTPTE
jgi:hypothetical protein